MKNNKIRVALLAVILIAAISLGIWFLVKPGPSAPGRDPNEMPLSTGNSMTDLEQLYNAHVQYKTLEPEVEEGEMLPFPAYDRFWLYDGRLCRLTYVATDGSYQLTSMESGETLKSYDSTCFAGPFPILSMDAEGNLWALYSDDDGTCRLGICEPECKRENTVLLEMPKEMGETWYLEEFAVREDLVCIRYCDDSMVYHLAVLNRANSEVEIIHHVMDFCFDDAGNLYTLIETDKFGSILEKHSLGNQTLWTQNELPFNSTSLWYLNGSSLFLLNGVRDQRSIATVDSETGELGPNLLDFWTDTDLRDEFSKYNYLRLGIDQDGQVCLSVLDYDLSSPTNQYCNRYTWQLKPFVPEVNSENAVTLTITAPYPVDSIMGSIRMYQREHPEIQIVWDTQYTSREEFQADSLAYKEQITMRTATGDVGDLQMILGAGISQEVITDTDAFADLTPYLEACPFKDELEWNLVETLRGEDGAIRAVPLGNVPMFFVYNASLLRELGSPINPDTVTWSGLLDLALQWEKNGTDLSLTSCAPGGEAFAKDAILAKLLLANLYDAEQKDGSIQLDQPYLRELLTKLHELWNTKQLIRADGDNFTSGFFEKSLYTVFSTDTSFSDRLSKGAVLSEREGVDFYAAPEPQGEVCKEQQGYAFCWGIPASSEHKDAAWDLLEFIISSKGLPGYAYSQDTDTLNNIAQEGRYNEYSNLGQPENLALFEQLQAIRKIPVSRFDEPYGWRDAVFIPIWDYLEGNCSLNEAMSLASGNWERFLKG